MATILIVEDKEQVRDLLVVTLLPHHQTIQADNPAQAMEMARAHRPQLILLDLHLQEKRDGLSVCRTLRSEPDPVLAGVPIVMLTGETGEEDIKAALEVGADSYVSKPYSPNALLILIDALLQKQPGATLKPTAQRRGQKERAVNQDKEIGSRSTGQKRTPLSVGEIIAKKRLAWAIELAQKNGALAFLAKELKSQLKEKDARVSTGQLEELIAQAARSITEK